MEKDLDPPFDFNIFDNIRDEAARSFRGPASDLKREEAKTGPLDDTNFNLSQCFFGDHLLADNKKKVGVVESEKTALIASLCLPEICWVACGAKEHLSDDKLNSLKGFDVILYPDLGAYDNWKEKADRYGYQVSTILEETVTPEERAAGYDLADYLLNIKPDEKCDFENDKTGKQVSKQKIPEPLTLLGTEPSGTQMASSAIPTEKVPPQRGTALKSPSQFSDDWTKEINVLETFFNTVELPAGPVKLGRVTTIRNIAGFIDSHLQIVKRNMVTALFIPIWKG